MSLTLRKNLSRPLTIEEGDNNFIYLNIKEWVLDDYLFGQYVFLKNGDIGIIYHCELTHKKNLYVTGQFTDTTSGGVKIWRKLGSDEAYSLVKLNGVELDKRKVLNFTGDFEIIDDPINEETIISVNSGGGVVSGTTEAGPNGTTTIRQNIITQDGSTIIIDLAPAFRYLNTQPTKVSVGGIQQNTTPFLNGATLHQIIQSIFYPAIAPTITGTISANLTRSGITTNLVTIGTVSNLTLNASFTRQTSTVSGQPNRFSGLPIDYNYSGTGITGTITNISSSLTNNTTLNNYNVIRGINSWSLLVNYGVGEQPVFDDGTPFTLPSFTNSGNRTSTQQFEGVFPIFATTVNITTLTQQNLISMINSADLDITLSAESGGNKHSFEIPNPWGPGRSLTGVFYFNTVSNAFDFANNRLNQFTVSSINKTINSATVAYSKYTHIGIDSGSRRILLRFS